MVNYIRTLSKRDLRRLQLWFAGLCVLTVACTKSFTSVNGQEYPDPQSNYYSKLQAEKSALTAEIQKSKSTDDSKLAKLASLQMQSSEFETAEQFYRKQWRDSFKVAAKDYNQKWVQSVLDISASFMDRGLFQVAQDNYRSVLQYEQSRCPKDDPRVARDYNNLGISTYMLAKTQRGWLPREQMLKEALTYYSQAEEIWRKNPQCQPQVSHCLQNIEVANSDLAYDNRASVRIEQLPVGPNLQKPVTEFSSAAEPATESKSSVTSDTEKSNMERSNSNSATTLSKSKPNKYSQENINGVSTTNGAQEKSLVKQNPAKPQ